MAFCSCPAGPITTREESVGRGGHAHKQRQRMFTRACALLVQGSPHMLRESGFRARGCVLFCCRGVVELVTNERVAGDAIQDKAQSVPLVCR